MNSEDDATSTSDRPTSDPRAFLSVSALVNGDITPSSPPVTQSQLHFPSHLTNLPLLPRRSASTPPMTPIPQLLKQNSPMLPTPPISEKNTTIVTGYFKQELTNSPERCKRQRTDGDSYALQFRPTVPIPLPKVESTATPTPPTTPVITVDKKDISTSSADSPRRRPHQTNTDNATLGKPRPLAQLPKATISKPSTAAQFTVAQLQTIKRCHEITQQFNCEISLLPKRMGDALWVELFSARVREAVANELEKQRGEGRNLEVNQKDITEIVDDGDRESRPVAQIIGPSSTDKRDVLKGISEHADNELPRATSAYKIGLPTSVSHEPSTSESMTSMTPTALFKRPDFPQNRTSHCRSSSLGNVLPQIISDQESKTPPAGEKWTITESCALPHPSILRTNGNGSPLAKHMSKLQYSTTNSNQSGKTPDDSNYGTSKVRKRTLHPKSHTSAIHTHTRSLSLDELKFGLTDFQKNRPTAYLPQAGRYRLNPAQPIQSPKAKIGSVREGENGSHGFVTDQRMDRLPLLADQMTLSTSYASNLTLQRSHVYPSQQSLRESHLSVADLQKQIAWDDHGASKQYIPTVTHHRPKSLNEKRPCASTTQARPYVQMIDPADTVHKTSRPFSSEQPTRPYHVATTEPKKETLGSKIPAATASSNSFLTDKNCLVTRNSFSTIRGPSLAPFVYHLPPIAHRPAPQSFGNGKRGFSPSWTNSYPEDMSGQDCQMYVRQKVVRSPASSAPSLLPQDKQ